VIVYSLPVVTANSGSICSGQSFTIIPAGAVTYTYSSGTPVVSPTTSSTYSITGSDNQGCVSSPAISSVSVQPSPSVTASSSGTICAGSSATLQANGAASYTWSGGQTTSSLIVSPGSTTSYSVNGTDTMGCSASFTVTQIVDPCTNIEGKSASMLSLKVYPNPNRGTFVVLSPSAAAAEIIDALGRVIQNRMMDIGENHISLPENAVNGIYFLRVKIGDDFVHFKILKQD
jgi:hypothetical protein